MPSANKRALCLNHREPTLTYRSFVFRLATLIRETKILSPKTLFFFFFFLIFFQLFLDFFILFYFLFLLFLFISFMIFFSSLCCFFMFLFCGLFSFLSFATKNDMTKKERGRKEEIRSKPIKYIKVITLFIRSVSTKTLLLGVRRRKEKWFPFSEKDECLIEATIPHSWNQIFFRNNPPSIEDHKPARRPTS